MRNAKQKYSYLTTYEQDNKLRDYQTWLQNKQKQLILINQREKYNQKLIKYNHQLNNQNTILSNSTFNTLKLDLRSKFDTQLACKGKLLSSSTRLYQQRNSKQQKNSNLQTKFQFIRQSINKSVSSARTSANQIQDKKYNLESRYYSQKKKKYDYGVQAQQKYIPICRGSAPSVKGHNHKEMSKNSEIRSSTINYNQYQNYASVTNKKIPVKQQLNYKHNQKDKSQAFKPSKSQHTQLNLMSTPSKTLNRTNIPVSELQCKNQFSNKFLTPQKQQQIQQLKQTQSLLIDRIKQRDEIIQKLQGLLRQTLGRSICNQK